MNYVENFLGYSKLFLSSEIDAGMVIATPVENIILYYVDPGDTEFGKAGLNYRVDGDTNLIGFHVNGNYNTAVSECFAIMGMTLFSEYLDGIAVVTFGGSFPPELTVTGEAGSTTFPWTDKTPSDFQSNVAVTNGAITGTLTFIEGGLAASGPLSGDGYFIALKWNAPIEGVTSLKVGLDPSEGTGLVEAINDPDRNCVCKITNKDTQKFEIIQSDANGRKNIQYFDLSGLTLTGPQSA